VSRQNVSPAKSSISKFSPRFAGAKVQTYEKHNTATMARSKTVTKKTETVVEAPVTTKVANGTPYQLDPSQVERAAKALVSHMMKHVEEKDEKAAVKNLADDEDEAEVNDQPIFLSISTKKHVNNTTSLKPTKMSV
jgi:ribosome biogenesis protein UTP30